jgi:hypothetical protein
MKELPYFKFYPAQWITGNISFLNYEEQGAFMKACCFYWSQECKLNKMQLKRIIPEESYNMLLDNGLIKTNGEEIQITWLDEQFKDRKKQHKTNVENGRKGGLKTQENNRGLSEALADNSSEAQALRKDKKRKEKIKKDNIIKDKIYTTTDPNLFVDDEIKNLLKK